MGTNFQAGQYDYCQHISIHMPREGHDSGHAAAVVDKKIFQSTCPARGTTSVAGITVIDFVRWYKAFQSTCPARGTTAIYTTFLAGAYYFNPRAPRGA